jgi:hypothetical protein
MRIFIPCLVGCLMIGCLSVAAAAAQITTQDFFDGFEGAWLSNTKELGRNHFSIEAQQRERFGYQGTLGTWVCAGIHLKGKQVSAGDAVRIVVPNGNSIAKLRAVYSYDRKTWQPVLTQRASFDFDVPLKFGYSEVYFATFYPYFHSQMVAHNRQLRTSRYVEFSTLGKSVHGREIPLATITDPEVLPAQKRRAFLIGGTHGAETASIYGVEGMLDFLVSDDPLAAEMRRAVIWKIVPILNVDAAAEGLDRRNAGGVNVYMDWEGHVGWKPPSTNGKPPEHDKAIPSSDFTQPETQAALKATLAFRPQVFLDVHSWHFAGDGFWGPDPVTTNSSTEALKQSIARYFKIAHWDHEVLPFTSAPTLVRKLGIAATLPEFALSFDSDNQAKTPESMRRQGQEILRGTYEYLKETK